LDRVTDQVEGFALQHFLDAHGIPVTLYQSPLAYALGDIPFSEAAASLYLEDPSRLEEALRLIERYRSGYLGVRGAAWTCTHCGENHEPQFGACWRCGTLRHAGKQSWRKTKAPACGTGKSSRRGRRPAP
jgi:hypothetical protein